MSMDYAKGHGYIRIAQGNIFGAKPRPRAGGGDFHEGEGGGDFRAVGNGQAIGRGAESGIGGDALHALGHDPGLRKTGHFFAEQAAWPQKRASGQRSEAAGADRPLRGTSTSLLSALPGTFEAAWRDPYTVRRGYSRRPPLAGDGTHDPPRLVPAMQEARRAAGARRPAERPLGQSRRGAFGLDALRTGDDLAADRGRFQSSLANEDQQRGLVADVASSAGDALFLVRTDSTRGVGVGRAARRRDGLARGGQNPLAVVFQLSVIGKLLLPILHFSHRVCKLSITVSPPSLHGII